MSLFHELDAAILLWGAAMVGYLAIRHFYFGGLRIQIGPSVHLAKDGAAREGCV